MRQFNKAIKAAELIEPTLHGRSFTLVMAHPTGNPSAKSQRDFHIVPRDELPCWGELRKYKSTHGKKYTLSDDYRPGDLYQPFPSGTPCALVIGLKNFHGALKEVLKEIIEESPWSVTLKDDIVEIKDKTLTISCKDITKGLRFDSTVFVNLLAYLKNISPTFYEETRKYLSPREAMFLSLSQRSTLNASTTLGRAYEYYFEAPSAYRFMNSTPRFLSNGAFGDGFDYDRERLQEVFSSDNPDLAYHPQDYFREKGYAVLDRTSYKMTGPAVDDLEKFCQFFREGLYEALANEEKELGINKEKDAA